MVEEIKIKIELIRYETYKQIDVILKRKSLKRHSTCHLVRSKDILYGTLKEYSSTVVLRKDWYQLGPV